MFKGTSKFGIQASLICSQKLYQESQDLFIFNQLFFYIVQKDGSSVCVREARGRGRESELEWGGDGLIGGGYKNCAKGGVECLCALSEG